MLMAIMSVSYFMVINSRFSSNPNLIPFFLMLYLYALLKLLNNNKVFSYKWAIVAGIGLGVGIQLHTTLFVSMPIMGLLVFAQLIKNKAAGTWKSFFVILGLVLALNVTQIISEVNTNWQNSKNFISGLHSDSKNNFGKDLVLITSCQIQANSFVLTSLQDDDRCQPIYQLPHGNSTRGFIYCLGMVLNILFSFVGYFLLFHFYKKETDTKKKNFLLLVAVVNVVSLAILLPVSGIMYLGYFLFLFYIPLILLGLMFKFLFEKFKQLGYAVVIFSMVILLALSLKRDHQVAIRYMDGSEDNYKNSTLGEVERMSSYMLSSAKNHPEIYIDGQKNITRRFYEPIKYFLRESGIGTTMAKQDKPVPPGMPLYYIDKKNSKTLSVGDVLKGRRVISGKNFTSQTILVLEN